MFSNGMRKMRDHHVGRLYGEPVDVQTADDGSPARFVWRGRLYAVRAVLEHWAANREWWRDPDPEAEMLYWRVEASAGQSMPSGPYELRKAGEWTLRQVED